MEQITKYGNFLTKINTNTEIGPGKSYMIIPLQSEPCYCNILNKCQETFGLAITIPSSVQCRTNFFQ